eukprot:96199-Ditylum_brightwellii.AAC.1
MFDHNTCNTCFVYDVITACVICHFMSLKPSMFYISDPVFIIVSVDAIPHHQELFCYKEFISVVPFFACNCGNNIFKTLMLKFKEHLQGIFAPQKYFFVCGVDSTLKQGQIKK